MLIDLSLHLGEDNPFAAGSPVAHLGHLGTHLDKDPAASVALDRLIGPGVLIDVSDVRGRQVAPEDLDRGPAIEPGDFVVLRTGWMAEAYPGPAYLAEHPELSWAAIDHLISLGPRMVGVDAPGLGRPDRHDRVDRHLGEHGIFVVENLANLEALTVPRFTVYCFPLALEGTSGVPARVVAEVA